MLHIHRSNSTASLVRVLADLTRAPRRNPVQTETVVVPSPGMETWLQQALAIEHRICANMHFAYPLSYLPELVAMLVAVGEGRSVQSPECRSLVERFGRWTSGALRWPVLDALKHRWTEPAFGPVQAFLSTVRGDDDREQRLYQLSGLLARAFERYLHYRPEWSRAWETDPSRHMEWQHILWRDVCGKLKASSGDASAVESAHLVQYLDAIRFQSELRWPDSDELPERLFVFGVSTLPPLFVQLLHVLGRGRDVHLLVATPSRQWMSGVTSSSLKVREELRALESNPDRDLSELHLDASPPLLASFGALAASFQIVLEESSNDAPDEHEVFHDPVTDAGRYDLLASLQHGLLELVDVAPEQATFADDRVCNIEVHRTHNAMRQVQVLHDRLLALLQDGTGIEDRPPHPHEIVVMCPDLDAFAPLIDAEFGKERGSGSYVPYAIADRSLRQGDPLADALLRVLELVGGRFTRREVLDVCALPPVLRKLGWSLGDLDGVDRGLDRASVVWGLDATHRLRHAGLASTDGTWEAGLDRLLLGAMVDEEPARLIGGMRPTSHAEGKAADAIAALAVWVDAVRAFDADAQTPATPAEWRQRLERLVDAVLAPDPNEAWRLSRLRETLAQTFEPWEQASPDAQAGFLLFRDVVSGALGDTSSAGAFLRGGITFCDMLPMRSVPFRVVALLGLDDGVFPRSDARTGVDLLERAPRRHGDRSRRDDDRYLVLEALTSAQDRLLVLHQGFDPQTGKEVPPSPVVDELLEAIVATHGQAVKARVVVDHPLQPHSVRNFKRGPHPEDRRSFNAAACRGAVASLAPREQAPDWLEGSLPAPAAAATQVSVRDLLALAKSPAKVFHQTRLGLSLSTFDYQRAPGDPIALDSLQQASVERDGIALRLNLSDAAQAESISRTSFGLPLGAVGDTVLKPAMAVAQVVANEVRAERGEQTERYVDLGVGDLEVAHGAGGTRTSVVGRIAGVVGATTLLRYDRSLKPAQQLQAWVEFLALCAVDPAVERLVTVGGKDGSLQRAVYRRPADACGLLAAWLDALAANAVAPIPFAPSAACAYAETAVALGVWGGDPEEELNEPLDDDLLAMRKAAIGAWSERDASYDPDCARLFPDAAAVVFPVDGAERSRFEALVASLVRPMLALREPTESDEDAEGGDE